MRRADRSMRRRAGAVLLEAIIALAILAIAGTATTSMIVESSETVAHAEQAERALQQASDFMDDVAVWPRADLDRHLGDRPEGAWRLRVDRPWPTLYTVVLTDSASGAVLLTTALYRPEPAR